MIKVSTIPATDLFSSIHRELKALLEGERGDSLVAIASVWGMLLGTRMVYPVILPYLRTSFDLSLTAAGLLITILWVGAAVGQLPSGVFADRYSERVVMSIGVTIVGLALVLVVLAPTALLLFVATGLVGLGQSLYPIARITLISDFYPERIGSALGATMAMGDLGQTVLPSVAGVLSAAIAWQVGLGIMIPLMFVAGGVIWVVLPTQPRTESAVDSLSVESARYVLTQLRRPNMLYVSFIFFLYFAVWQAFTGFYPTYLIEVKGLSSAAAGVLFSVFFACGIVVKPAAGAAYDRIGTRRALIAVLVGPVVGLVLLTFVDGFWPIAGITAVISVMLGSGAITQAFLTDSFAEDMRGTGLGVVRTTVSTLGAMGPVIFGGIAERGYFDEGYLLLATILVVVLLLTHRLRHERP